MSETEIIAKLKSAGYYTAVRCTEGVRFVEIRMDKPHLYVGFVKIQKDDTWELIPPTLNHPQGLTRYMSCATLLGVDVDKTLVDNGSPF